METKELRFDFNNVDNFARDIGVDNFLEVIKTMEQARANIEERNIKKVNNQKTYLIRDKEKDLVKIGKSNNPDLRKKSLSISSDKLELLHTIDVDVENKLHEKYAKKRVFGEWFNLNKKDIKGIKNGEY